MGRDGGITAVIRHREDVDSRRKIPGGGVIKME